MSVRDFVPHRTAAILFAAFWLSSVESAPLFEEQLRHRLGTQITEMIIESKAPQFAQALLGFDTWFGLLVSVAFWLSGLFVIAFLIAYAFDNGWRRAVGLVLIAIVLNVSRGVCLVLLGVDESDEANAVVAGLRHC